MKLLLAFACAFALSPFAPAQRTERGDLDILLARYAELPAGAERDALERQIDALAGQRYGAYSRLFWYRDLDRAKAAARAEHKPILSLRMLGRLDEDLSCANSRFFRVALYANGDLSRFLRENFVLHWSSERPVPQVTIDFGDGRVLHTTLAGNSAHFVLDQDGRPIDVLPGLYTPPTFRAELEKLLPLARSSPTLDDTTRAQRIGELHAQHDAEVAEFWNDPSTASAVPSLRAPGIGAAERVTTGKLRAELSIVAALDPRAGLAAVSNRMVVHRAYDARLDGSSLALFERLAPRDLSPVEINTLRADFERSMAADTQLDEESLRPRIHQLFERAENAPTFDYLVEAIYAEVFLTPRGDEWLGIANAAAFNGLPDGGRVR